MGEFNSNFSSEFSGGSLVTPIPPPLPSYELLDCPQVEFLTGTSTSGNPAIVGARYPDYAALRDSFPDYSGLSVGHASYAGVMEGHPGFVGEAPAVGSRGYGLWLGVRDLVDVEWWVSEVEGWDSGPQVDPIELEPVGNGTWIDRVRAKGREVTVKGWVLSPDVSRLVRAKRQLAAALASPPHFGVMRVGGAAGLRLPVALTEAMKVKQISETAVEFEVTVKGRDSGTPGSGVWLEGASRDVVLGVNSTVDVSTDSFVASRPTIRMEGPLTVGQRVTDGRATIQLAQSLGAGQTLLIDCATWQVSLFGGLLTAPVPARFMLTAGSSRLEIDHATETLSSSGPSASGRIVVTITDIY